MYHNFIMGDLYNVVLIYDVIHEKWILVLMKHEFLIAPSHQKLTLS